MLFTMGVGFNQQDDAGRSISDDFGSDESFSKYYQCACLTAGALSGQVISR
jgi:hypothetical protein